MFGDHGLCGLLEEGAHRKSPKCLGGNLGDFGEFCKGLGMFIIVYMIITSSHILGCQEENRSIRHIVYNTGF